MTTRFRINMENGEFKGITQTGISADNIMIKYPNGESEDLGKVMNRLFDYNRELVKEMFEFSKLKFTVNHLVDLPKLLDQETERIRKLEAEVIKLRLEFDELSRQDLKYKKSIKK